MQKSDKEIREIIKNYRNGGLKYSHGTKKRVFGKHKIIDGKIQLDTVFNLYNALLDENCKIPFEFTENKKQTIVSAHNLSSLWELPRRCVSIGGKNYTEALIFTRNMPKIKTLEGITPEIYGGLRLNMQNEPGFSLTGIHKHLKILHNSLILDHTYKGPLLGLLLIQDLRYINFSYTIKHTGDRQNLQILRTIIHSSLQSDRDILECQEKLISNGFKEYAKL